MNHNDSMLTSPTKPHRLSVPLSNEVYDAYTELANALGKSTGSTIAEWLQDSVESARMMAVSVRQIKQSPHEAMRRVAAMAEAAELMAENTVNKASGNKPVSSDFGARAQLAGTAPKSSKKGLTPPSSNTGGKVGGKQNPRRVQK